MFLHRGEYFRIQLECNFKIHSPNSTPIVDAAKRIPNFESATKIVDRDIERPKALGF